MANDGNYSLAQGEEDKDRLLILNEVYNPASASFWKEVDLKKGDAVLELGCGMGKLSQHLANIVGPEGSVVATDISEEQLVVARSLLANPAPSNLLFKQLSAYELDSLKEKFDVVYVRFLLCHLPNPEVVLRQVKGVLKPGGRFIIEDLVGSDSLYSEPHHQGVDVTWKVDKLQFDIQSSDEYYFNSLPRLLEEAGFTVVKDGKAHPLLDTPRKRKLLTYNFTSLKDALIGAQKITPSEYDSMYSIVEDLEKDLSFKVHTYRLGQICATV